MLRFKILKVYIILDWKGEKGGGVTNSKNKGKNVNFVYPVAL